MTITIHVSVTGHMVIAGICNYLLPLPIRYSFVDETGRKDSDFINMART